MNKKPVLFIDSGIGGLPYCLDFSEKNPQEEICYTADTQNFPYGPRKKDDLTAILTSLTEKLIKMVNPKIIVLACNTATICALESLRRRFTQIPFVGTVPALKPAAKISSNRKVGVLGTERTIEGIRQLHIVDNSYEIVGIAAPELVEFIEFNFDDAGETEKKTLIRKYVNLFRAEGVESIVLGCTHFLFLLEEFHSEALNAGFNSHIEVFDSLSGITKRIEFLLDENYQALRAKNAVGGDKGQGVRRILLTGKSDSFWKNRAQKFGFKLNMLKNYE